MVAIRQVMTFRARPGEGDLVGDGLRLIVEKVRNSPGCEQYDLFRSDSEPDVFVVLERWTTPEAMEAALRRHYRGPDDPDVEFLKHLAGAPDQEQCEV